MSESQSSKNVRRIANIFLLWSSSIIFDFLLHNDQLTKDFYSWAVGLASSAIMLMVIGNKKCLSCGNLIGPKRFCGNCGWQRYCPTCKKEKTTGSQFCSHCGGDMENLIKP